MVLSSLGFEMQARTARVRDKDREEGRATVFTGGVAKDNGSYTYQVELADNRQGMSTSVPYLFIFFGDKNRTILQMNNVAK